MTQAASEMSLSLARARTALSHNLTKGEAVEESFRRFLRAHLPQSIGVTKGQAVDSKGNQSRQLDVMLYDTRRTPMLFTSDDGEHQLVPSEGLIAVFEVKTHLGTSDVPGIVQNMLSVKTLDKSAYYYPQSPLLVEHHVYGGQYRVIPTMYFAFGFEGDSPQSVAAKLTECQSVLPVERRVDCACILDSGVVLNYLPSGMINGLPEPSSTLAGYNTSKSLLMFYLFFSRFVLQVEHFGIDIQRYVPADLAL